MKFPHFFIERPIFATVVALIIVLLGTLSYVGLPVSQYPDVVPPTIVVSTNYPGASADVVAKTVATPLEEEINGVENMLYMESQSTSNGDLTLTVTFELGTDLDLAQIHVQNRVAIAEPRLPDDVRRIGVTTSKRSPDMLLVVHLYSPNNTFDQLYISNYANLHVRDVLSRIDGVGDVILFGAREYAMRLWLDVDYITELNMTPGDVVNAVRAQNIQVPAGTLGSPPLSKEVPIEWTVNTLGRLTTPEQFADIIVKTLPGGRIVRLKDVARVELGALDYSMNSYLDKHNASAIGIFQRPGSNAIATTNKVLETVEKLSKQFPPGLEYTAVYNPTVYVEQSIHAVIETLFIAWVLVILVIFLFLQTWRATIIPVVAIPVSLIGTLALMKLLGFSLNTLSLFGLVLAIGIVVDDAIVVVENVERNIEEGLAPKEATHRAMDEVSSALVSIGLVLVSVFVPTAFLGGITGQFYRQFALTVAGSMTISVAVSLILSPAMCALFLKPLADKEKPASGIYRMTLGGFFRGFNRLFENSRSRYGHAVSKLVRITGIALVVYVGLIGLTIWAFQRVPTGFIPTQDQGYLIISVQLPEGASLMRTDAVTRRVSEIVLGTPGVKNAVSLAGLQGTTRTTTSNAATVFAPLQDSTKRGKEGLLMPVILADLRKRLSVIEDAYIVVIPPPPVRGIGTAGGFDLRVEDQSGAGPRALLAATLRLIGAANKAPGLVQVFTTFEVDNPEVFIDIDRTQVSMLQVPFSNLFDTLQVYLGSLYINDFNFLGRTWQVRAQAESRYRRRPSDIEDLKTRSSTGAIVPLGAVASIQETTTPNRIMRYNLYPASDVHGDTAPGYSSGQSLATMERLAKETLPEGMGFEWTGIAFQEKLAGNVGIYIFALSVLFVFLALSAQYESWLLPLAIILIVPLCLLFSLAGIAVRGIENDILTQIGFIVLVGLATKNAILIVEFAKQQEDRGLNRFDAVVAACRLRIRPILMTAFAFIFGTLPLLIASGPGYEMRRAVGTAVFSGMAGVTLFGLFLTPVFYVVLRKLGTMLRKDTPAA